MCGQVSFVIETGPRWRVLAVGALANHEDVIRRYRLRPGSYREAEWTAPDTSALTVRTEPDGDHEPGQYIAWVLAHFPTRLALLEHLQTQPAARGYELDDLLARERRWTLLAAINAPARPPARPIDTAIRPARGGLRLADLHADAWRARQPIDVTGLWPGSICTPERNPYGTQPSPDLVGSGLAKPGA